MTCCLAKEMSRRGNEVSIVSIFGVKRKCHFDIGNGVKFEILTDTRYGADMTYTRRAIEILRITKNVKHCKNVTEADIVIAQKFFAVLCAVFAGFADKTLAGDHFPYEMYGSMVRWFRNRIYAKTRQVVVLTEEYADKYRNAGVEKAVVVPNMIPFNERKHDTKARTIIAVGRLAREKGFDMLVEAFAREAGNTGDRELKIYGEGEMRDELKNQIKKAGMDDRIKLMGMTDDIESVYAEADFGVMSSRYEGFPMVLLEAAACGLPMVSFDCPTGPREILKDGGGLLVENGNVKALGEAIVRMANDKTLRLKLGKECAKIAERYSAERVCSQWEELLRK